MKLNLIQLLSLLGLFSLSNSKNVLNECPIQGNIIDVPIRNQQIIPCLRYCLKKGWNQCTYKMIQLGEKEQKQQLITILTEERKRLESLEELIVLGESQTEPVLKWGQNMTHIFITFKLSHRWDSPPCLNTKSEASQISSKNLFYQNICLVSHQKVTFKLNLDLYRDVIGQGLKEQVLQKFQNNQVTQEVKKQESVLDVATEQSENINPPQSQIPQKMIEPSQKFQVKKDGVGTYSTILQKLKPQIWLFLDKKMKNYALWNQIGARYSQDLRTQQSLLEQYRALVKRQKKDSNIPKSQNHLKYKFLVTSALLLVMALLLM